MTSGWTGGQYSLWRFAAGLIIAFHFLMMVPKALDLMADQSIAERPADWPLTRVFRAVDLIHGNPKWIVGLVSAGVLAAILFGIGVCDRSAAFVLALLVWALVPSGFVTISWGVLAALCFLLAHSMNPSKPFGSWAAHGRVDPAGSWQMPQGHHIVLWTFLAAVYSYAGWHWAINGDWVAGGEAVLWTAGEGAHLGLWRDLKWALPSILFVVAQTFSVVACLAFVPLAILPRTRPWA